MASEELEELIQSCLGISVDGNRKQVVLDRPYLPEGVPQLRIGPLRAGASSVNLHLERHGQTVQVHVLEKQGDIEVVLK